MRKTPIKKGDIAIGVPLRFDVYDQTGRLLLRRENVITSEAQLERLINEGLYADIAVRPDRGPAMVTSLINASATPADQHKVRVSVFDMLRVIRNQLEGELFNGDPGFPEQVVELALGISRACDLDCDAALASILIDRQGRFPIRHAMNAAIVTAALAKYFEQGETDRLSTIAAALTMNIAILDLQETLHAQSEALTPAQSFLVRAHPTRGAQLLAELGVQDEAWLTTVAEHHEAFDGTGYPNKLLGHTISTAAQLVSAADKYCAMVTERAYRAAAAPPAALKQLLVANRSAFNPALASLLAKEIGYYAPGTVVELANGDVAVTVKRSILDPKHPVVRSVFNSRGEIIPGFPKRLTSKLSYSVSHVHAIEELGTDFDATILWEPTWIAAEHPGH